MTNTELMNLKAALEAKQMELAAQLRGRVKELTIEGGHPELVDWIQVMSNRDETAGMLNRLSSTLADVKRSLRAIDDDCYGNCIRCEGPIAIKRLQSIPWAANCVRCQEQVEAGEEYAASAALDFYQPKAA
jgi:DnaK suppressor protein